MYPVESARNRNLSDIRLAHAADVWFLGAAAVLEVESQGALRQ